jgi:osmotically-inducible protein OsmY
MNKSDSQLKQDVEQELLWDPLVNAAQVAVSVDRGAVSLFGAVDTYPAKWAAEDATKRVHGVRAVAHDLTVKIVTEHARSDSEIAASVQAALEWDVFVPKTVTATVEAGAVTIDGEVALNYQRQAAERAVRYRKGVVDVVNRITIKPSASASQVKDRVEAALARRGTSDAKSIHVDTAGGAVTLSGSACHWQSIEHATNAAWAVPGVTEVVNHVQMSPSP